MCMSSNKEEIQSIIFGVLSPTEIIKQSVANINSSKMSGPGSIYDERLGSLDPYIKCVTCGYTNKGCGGHFGHIELNEPILHPFFIRKIMIIIRCFCINPDCNRILITKEKINFLNLDSKLNNKARFNKLAKVLEKIPLCCRCNRIQPKISLIHTEGIITRTIKSGGGGEKITVQMTVREIKKMFESLEDEDLDLFHWFD